MLGDQGQQINCQLKGEWQKILRKIDFACVNELRGDCQDEAASLNPGEIASLVFLGYCFVGVAGIAGLENRAASIEAFACTSLSSVVDCPSTHVTVHLNGNLTPDTAR